MTIPHSVTANRPITPERAPVELVTDHGRAIQELSTSVAKALALLSSFTPDHPAMGVSDLARCAGLPKSTAHRLLAVLVDWSLVTKTGTEYSPGPRLGELAALADRPDVRQLRRVALPYLLDLYELTHETVHLGVLESDEVLYVDKIYGHHSVASPSRVGGRLPATNSAIGKAMLAFAGRDVVARVCDQLRPTTSFSIATPNRLLKELAAIRDAGIAFDRQETTHSLTCVAAPVLSWSGTVIAAVSIAGPTHRFRPSASAAAVRVAAASVAKAAQETSWYRFCS